MENILKYKKQLLLVYIVICAIFTVISVLVPYQVEKVDKLNGKGNTNIGNITNDTKIEFYYTNKETTLTKLFFYLENNDRNLTAGTITFQALTADTMKEVGTLTVDLSVFENDAYVIVPINNVGAGQKLLVSVSSSGIKESPTLAVNTSDKIDAVTMVNGQEITGNLVAATAATIQMHSVKKPIIRFIMLGIIGILLFILVENKKETEEQILMTKNKKMNPVFANLQKVFKKLQPLIVLGIVLFIITVIFYYLYDTQIRKAMNTSDQQIVMTDDGNKMPITSDMKEIRQTFVCKEKTAVGLGFKLDIPNSAIMSGDLRIQILNKETQEILCDTQMPLNEILSGQYIGLVFKHSQMDSYNEVFEIIATMPDNLTNQTMSLYITGNDAYPDNTLMVDGQARNYSMGMIVYTNFHYFVRTYFLTIYAFICIVATILYYMIAIKNSKIEKIFLVSVISLGIVYSFIILPYMAPDEETHIGNAYRYSDVLLGEETGEDGICLKRQDDVNIPLTSEASLNNYKYVYNTILKAPENTSLVEAETAKSTGASFFVYLPAAIGISIARILGLNSVLMLLFGRWANMLAFVLLAYFGMKKLPFGKITLFILSIMPMTIQQISSFSYDSVTLGIAFLFTCCCLSLAYGNNHVRGRDVLLLTILSVGIIYSKGGVYLPLAFAFLLIPHTKFAKKSTYLKTILLMGLFVGLTFIYRNMAIVTSLGGLSSSQSSISGSGETAYTLSYLLGHPMKGITVLANTVVDKSEFYVQSLVGQKLGWVSIDISNVVIIAFVVLLLLSTLKSKNEKVYFKPVHKLFIFILAAGSYGLILAAMLLAWTPVTHVSIEGVHGRYFLPFMLLLLLIVRNNKIQLEKNMDRIFMASGLSLQVLSIMYLLKDVIGF